MTTLNLTNRYFPFMSYNSSLCNTLQGYSNGQFAGLFFANVITGIGEVAANNIFRKSSGSTPHTKAGKIDSCAEEYVSGQKEYIEDLKAKVTTAEAESKTAKTNYDAAVKAFDEKNSELKGKIDTLTTGVATYKAAEKAFNGATENITKYKGNIKDLETEGAKSDCTAARKAEIEQDIAHYKSLIEEQQKIVDENRRTMLEHRNDEKDLETAKKDYEDLQSKDKDLTKLKGIMKAKEDALNKAKENLKNAEAELKKFQAQEGLGENMSSVKTGKISGNGTYTDANGNKKEVSNQEQFQKFKKASAKFASDPYSLTPDEINLLKKSNELADALSSEQNTYQTDSMKTVIGQLREWSATYSGTKEFVLAEKLAKGAALTNDDIETLIESGYMKQKDREVGGKMRTVYQGKDDNRVYIQGENEQYTLIEHERRGNIFQKAKYKAE